MLGIEMKFTDFGFRVPRYLREAWGVGGKKQLKNVGSGSKLRLLDG